MILVVGATGVLGGMIVHRLRAQGKPVRALVRSAAAAEPLQQRGAEICIGDLELPDTLQAACEGVERVVSTATAALKAHERPDAFEAVDVKGTRNLIDASKAAGARQFVYVSAYGFTPDAPHPLARAKGSNEVYLRDSGLLYTLLQPVLFMESWIGFALGAQLQHGPRVTIVGSERTRYGFVATDNVADLAVAVLGHPAAKNAAIPLNGPGTHSYREVVDMIAGVTGQTIQINSIPPGQPVPGMPPILNELWALLSQLGDSTLDTTDIARTYGVQLLSVRDFVQRTFGA
jgi:uncharacterized protein YbjT (DUF2867 family)